MSDPNLTVLNEHFDKIFVITLERAHDRHANIAQSLAGVNYEIVYGVDKRDLDFDSLRRTGDYLPERAKKLNRYTKERLLPLGAIACSLSHRGVYQRLLDSGHERALVFEDDVLPIPQNLPTLAGALNELPTNWELLYLGYITNERPISALRAQYHRMVYSMWHDHVYRWRAKDVDRLFPRPFSPSLHRAGYHNCTHAYALTRAAAEKLIASQTPVNFCADSVITHHVLRKQLEAFSVRRQLFSQMDFTLGHQHVTSYVCSD